MTIRLFILSGIFLLLALLTPQPSHAQDGEAMIRGIMGMMMEATREAAPENEQSPEAQEQYRPPPVQTQRCNGPYGTSSDPSRQLCLMACCGGTERAKLVQSHLKTLGYYNGAIDGMIGIGTEKAIKNWEVENVASPDGVFSASDLDVMEKQISTIQNREQQPPVDKIFCMSNICLGDKLKDLPHELFTRTWHGRDSENPIKSWQSFYRDAIPSLTEQQYYKYILPKLGNDDLQYEVNFRGYVKNDVVIVDDENRRFFARENRACNSKFALYVLFKSGSGYVTRVKLYPARLDEDNTEFIVQHIYRLIPIDSDWKKESLLKTVLEEFDAQPSRNGSDYDLASSEYIVERHGHIFEQSMEAGTINMSAALISHLSNHYPLHKRFQKELKSSVEFMTIKLNLMSLSNRGNLVFKDEFIQSAPWCSETGVPDGSNVSLD